MPATRTGAATSADPPDAFWDEPDEEDDELEPAADHAGAARSAAGAAVLGASFGGPAACGRCTLIDAVISALFFPGRSGLDWANNFDRQVLNS